MLEFKHKIKDPVGLHARPAGLLVKKAGEYQSKISLMKDNRTADAKSMLSIMALGAKTENELLIRIEGQDEEVAMTELEQFFEANL